ncbi:MAG: helix-turn-helix domain-containing protein [Akkermansiaceae bacterium]|nr:helix-turn-helix domain-containing protein [Akkermansiaceae bacterium]
MKVPKDENKTGGRVAYSFAETAEMFGRERTWVYRQVKRGRIRAIIGFGAAMIPASEIERISTSTPTH